MYLVTAVYPPAFYFVAVTQAVFPGDGRPVLQKFFVENRVTAIKAHGLPGGRVGVGAVAGIVKEKAYPVSIQRFNKISNQISFGTRLTRFRPYNLLLLLKKSQKIWP